MQTPALPLARSKKPALLTVAALVAVTLVAGAALAGPRGLFSKDEAKARRAIAHVVDDVMDDLDATDAQRKAAHDVASRLYADVAPLRAEKDGARDDVRALLLDDAPDATAVHAKVDARTASMTKAAHRTADAFLELHAILTPEQRAVLVEKLDERAGRGHHRRGWF